MDNDFLFNSATNQSAAYQNLRYNRQGIPSHSNRMRSCQQQISPLESNNGALPAFFVVAYENQGHSNILYLCKYEARVPIVVRKQLAILWALRT